MVEGSERVYYAMDGAGIGQIVDGLSGNLYTAEQDDLISNSVNAMQIWQGQLFVGTPIGVSRFANNLFTDQNAGLGSLVVNDFAVESSGALLAATNGGIYRWNDGASTWQYVWAIGAWVTRISCRQDEIWALGIDNLGNGVMQASSGGSLARRESAECQVPIDPGRRRRVDRRAQPADERCAFAGTGLPRPPRSRRPVHASRLRREPDPQRRRASRSPATRPGSATGAAAPCRKLEGGAWSHLWESANAAADSNGLFTAGGNVLGMAAGPDGTVWAVAVHDGHPAHRRRHGQDQPPDQRHQRAVGAVGGQSGHASGRSVDRHARLGGLREGGRADRPGPLAQSGQLARAAARRRPRRRPARSGTPWSNGAT